MKDYFHTLKKKSPEIIFKERGSKFYGNAFPIQSAEEVNPIIEDLRKRYPKAGHHCYAWKLGITDDNHRANDDGEPAHSAGDPILGQIKSFDLSDVLVVVSRIFGGTKLGVGGLINAYRETAKLALLEAEIIEKVVTGKMLIKFTYNEMSQVMRTIKENDLSVLHQDFKEKCELLIEVQLNKTEEIKAKFESIYPVQVEII